MEEWTLITAVIAAAAGSLLLLWTWIDRPQLGWNVRLRPILDPIYNADLGGYEPATIRGPHICEVHVRADGSGVAHSVGIRSVGCTPIDASEGLTSTRMTSGSEPLIFRVACPGTDAGASWIEVIWSNLRPRGQRGFRLDLHTQAEWRYRWRWSSLRLRGRGSELRLQRTHGRWVNRKRSPRPIVPETEGATRHPVAEKKQPKQRKRRLRRREGDRPAT